MDPDDDATVQVQLMVGDGIIRDRTSNGHTIFAKCGFLFTRCVACLPAWMVACSFLSCCRCSLHFGPRAVRVLRRRPDSLAHLDYGPLQYIRIEDNDMHNIDQRPRSRSMVSTAIEMHKIIGPRLPTGHN